MVASDNCFGRASVEQVLEMMTDRAAFALGVGQAVGRLRSGKIAGLVLSSDNPLGAEPDLLRDLELLLAIVGGGSEHCAEGRETPSLLGDS